MQKNKLLLHALVSYLLSFQLLSYDLLVSQYLRYRDLETNMKKYFRLCIVLILTFTLTVFSSISVEAQGNGLPDSSTFSVTKDVLDGFDPLKTQGSAQATALSTPGGIISRALSFAFPIAGMILFVMIVVGGLEILGGAANSKSLQSGQQRVTMAILGFMVLFASYWITQILELIFGIAIL